MFDTINLVPPSGAIEIAGNGEERVYSTGDIIEKIDYWTAFLSEVDGDISIDLPRSLDLVCILYVLLRRRIPFSFPRGRSDAMTSSFLLRHNQLIRLSSPPSTPPSTSTNNVCYSIFTSGSTGNAKRVDVPFECIWANILDFRSRFSICPSDRVLFSTSVHFDPSIVELFLPFATGCSIVIVPDSARSNPHLLVDVLRVQRPTVCQFTPAVLSLLNEEILRWMLSEATPIRILLVGGDKFPLSLLSPLRSPSNSTRIFDLYGITEVSCWASAFEVPHRCEEVLLGPPISGTRFLVSQDKELLIGFCPDSFDRRCLVDGVVVGEYVKTGDVVEQTDEGQLRIVGRRDDQVKINGVLCHLSSLSASLILHDDVIFARFVYWKQSFLVLFAVTRSGGSISSDVIDTVCPPLLRPARIIYLNGIPVNKNGKTDLVSLYSMLETSKEDQITLVEALLKKYRIPMTSSSSFVHHGFSSLEAAELSLLLSNASAMSDILSAHVSVHDVIKKYLADADRGAAAQTAPTQCAPLSVHFEPIRQPAVKWAYNSGKCIDGTPLVVDFEGKMLVVVASHSGRVAVIGLDDGRVEWELDLPTRFEASPAVVGDIVVVGGYSGVLYFISLSSGLVEWEYQTDGEIKAAVAVLNSEVYVISYDKRLSKVCCTTRTCLWSAELTSGSPSQPLLLDEDGITVVVCTTIKGTVEAFDTQSGSRNWLVTCPAPIFSPAVSHGRNLFVTAVDGSVRKMAKADGKLLDSLCLPEPIFAPVSVLEREREGEEYEVVVLTQHGLLALISIDDWIVTRTVRLPGCSFVRAPLEVRKEGEKREDGGIERGREGEGSEERTIRGESDSGDGVLMLQSTDGYLIWMDTRDLRSGDLQRPLVRLPVCSLSSHVFSRPLYLPDRRLLVVASRDDWLRVMECSAV